MARERAAVAAVAGLRGAGFSGQGEPTLTIILALALALPLTFSGVGFNTGALSSSSCAVQGDIGRYREI